MRSLFMAALIALSFASAPVGDAQAASKASKVWTGISAAEFLSEMESQGFAGNLDVDNDGDPMINGMLNGVKYHIYFYECNSAKKCTGLMFQAAWVNNGSTTMQKMNIWNQEHRFGTAYLDQDGDPAISYGFAIAGGATTALIHDGLDWWRVILNEFSAEVG